MAAIGMGLLIIANAADYVSFLVMVARHGLGVEMNPIVATLARDHGLLLLSLAKVSAVLLVASTFLVVARTRPRLAGTVLAVGIAVGGLGALSNLATL
jgi:hypothetical protein